MAGSGPGWSAKSAGIGPSWLTSAMNFAIAGPKPLAQVRLADVRARRQRRLAVGQHLGGRRLVRDERPDLLRVLGHQGQRVDRAAAAGEEVDRAGAERRDQPVQVVGVLVGRGLAGAVGALAALDAARVVGDDRAVGEVAGQGGEAGGAHRRPDDQQDRLGAGRLGSRTS